MPSGADPSRPSTAVLGPARPDPAEPRARNGHAPPPPAEPPVGPPVAAAALARARPVGPVLVVLLLGLVGGALVGGGIGAGAAPGAQATTLLQLLPVREPGLGSAAAPGSTEDAFVVTEVAWLAGPGLVGATRARLGGGPVGEIGVIRVADSSMAELTATGPTDPAAVATLEAAVAVYAERRGDQFRTDLDAALARVEVGLRELGGPDTTRTELSAPDQVRFDRLVASRADLQLIRDENPAPVQVLEPPTPLLPDGPTTGLLAALLGAVVGGLVATAAHALWRSRTRLLLAPVDALVVTDRLLHPEVRLRRRPGPRARTVAPPDPRTARLLVGQIARRRPLEGSVIAVVGPCAGSGSRTVAALIADGAAGLARTTLVELEPEPSASPGPSTGGPARDRAPSPVPRADPARAAGPVVVPAARADAPGPLPVWSAVLDEARAAGRCVVLHAGANPDLAAALPPGADTVLVLGIGVDDAPSAAAFATALHGSRAGAPYGVLTRLPWPDRWLARWRRG